jgi:glucose/arabinose dehydrogenase
VRRLGVALLACLGIALLIPARAAALPRGTHVQLFMGGLNSPVDMAYVFGTRKLFFTEKDTGAIRVIQNGSLLPTPCVDLDVVSDGERGALGLAVDPSYRKNHFLYVYFTKRSPLENRVTRFTVVRNRCTAARPIITGIPSVSGYHNGGQLLFVRGKLYVTVGEGHDAGNAQLLTTRLGKVLRYNPNGSIPSDNPFLVGGHRSPIWSYGHRNGFGLVRKPGTQLLYESENGPSCDDELNRIMRGRNYGWGNDYVCGTNGVGPNPVAPLKRWTPTIAPTDPWWYGGSVAALRGSIYLGDFNTGTLRRITLNQAGTAVRSIGITYHAPSGIIDVSSGPGGWLYFATQSAIYRIVG